MYIHIGYCENMNFNKFSFGATHTCRYSIARVRDTHRGDFQVTVVRTKFSTKFSTRVPAVDAGRFRPATNFKNRVLSAPHAAAEIAYYSYCMGQRKLNK